MDDNIRCFYRRNRNQETQVTSGTIFKCAEDFTERYENVAIAGFQYSFFSKVRHVEPAFRLNTRIYSCLLIDNNLDYRWRGRYNEDTDLSLRVLKDGWCTVLFYAFLQYKAETMTLKGGNTDELYRDDGRLRMAEQLKEQHPDLVSVIWRFSRWQHHVDYEPFKRNRLIKKAGVMIPTGIDNYGMILKRATPPTSAGEGVL